MDRYGIQAQVLSISDPGVSYLDGVEAAQMARYCNTYVAELISWYPTRFGGFAVLPMPDLDTAITELIYALDVLKLDGIILLSAYNWVYLGDATFDPLMAELAARNAFVFVHPRREQAGAAGAGLPLRVHIRHHPRRHTAHVRRNP